MQLVLVSRLINPKLPIDFSSLCTYVNYSPSHTNVCCEIKWNTLLYMQPELIEYKQELYYKTFSCMSLLSKIDEIIMNIVREKAGTKELWTDTSALIKLAEKRSQVFKKICFC